MSTSDRSTYENSTKGFVVAGVTGFAGVMLMTVAIFQILEGIAAIANDKLYIRGLNYAYQFDVTTWGWIHLVIGLLAIACGVGVILGKTWAYVAALVIAFLSALGNFAFIPQAPLWSIIIIAFDVLVMWALVVELNEPQ